MKLDLEAARALLDALGAPEKKLRILHVAGTNGKGSTAAIAEAILREAGWRTGLYTSPHLIDFAERIRVDGRTIGRRALLDLTGRVIAAMPEVASRVGRGVTFFEATTAMAFLHFAERGVEAAVIETGMGGRYDATNVATPLVCAITPISLEHQRYLGRTLAAIAGEKAAIVKRGVPVVSAAQAPAARRVIQRRAREQGACLSFLGRDFHALAQPEERFDYVGLRAKLPGLRCGLLGPHQQENAAVALAACERLSGRGLAVGERDMRRGVTAARLAGRLERVLPATARRGAVVLDGAHNPAGARALARALPRVFSYRRLVLVCGAMSDKDLPKLLGPLAREVRRTRGIALATAAAFDRSASGTEIARALRKLGARARTIPSVAGAVDAALRESTGEDLVLVSGSFYVVGEARAHLSRGAGRAPVLPGAV